ncbi:MAG: cytochrome P450 [Pseudomonadota bacterium]|nr:cytochrome P450 [Pseudomonadota bacterium]
MAAELLPVEIAAQVIDPKVHADGARLHEAFRWIRANNPLGRAELEGFDPFWVVSKHADILEVSRQNALFHSGDRQTTFTSQEADQKVWALTGGSPHLVRSLVQMDEPDHMKYRALTQGWFMPQNLKKLEGRIREIARGFVHRMVDHGGECDFVADVALHFPLHVIMEILGVPEADEPRMLKLTQELFGASDSELNREGEAQGVDVERGMAQIQAVLADFFMYFNTITEARRAHPTDDLSTVIANGRINGEPISPFEAMSYYVIVATAGHDTTSSSTAGAMWALCENPAELAKVKADPALIPGLVEESIRWTTPVRHFMRSATADTELRGRKIAEGDWLMLCYPSGNRDEEVFEDPFAFRVDRAPNRQLAFGYGAHLCLGQHLAKMEMRILWDELLPRLASVEFAGEPKLSEGMFVNGPKRLPIRYRMA